MTAMLLMISCACAARVAIPRLYGRLVNRMISRLNLPDEGGV